jgi:parallel beta-helix repeat protein
MSGKFASLIALAVIVVSVSSAAFKVQSAEASGTIYIRANGIVEGTDKISNVNNVTYTFTDNINDSIVVERNNTVIDGADHTLQGAGSWAGIDLTGRSNVTIKSVVIKGFRYGIDIDSSSDISVCGNNVTNNIKDGIILDGSSHNRIFGNNVTNNDEDGITLGYSSDYNDVFGNSIIGNDFDGIVVHYSSNYNSLFGSNVIDNGEDGIDFYESSHNNVYENIITENWVNGIDLDYSNNNSIFGNDITENNYYSISLKFSSENRIYHNNFINDTMHLPDHYTNTWDDGYPSGGNYWSDYNGIDVKSGSYQNETGSDGVGDTPYIIDANNTDHYPLMGMFQSYNVTYFTPPLVAHSCSVTVISNSTVSNFVTLIWIEHPEVIMIEFNVTEEQGTTGFCRVSFPTAMMNGTYHVLVNGTEVPYTLLPYSNADHSHLYFTYTHSTEGVIIIPEFPSFLILPLFMIVALLALIVHKRKHLV